jgi:hypothetical protein
VLNGDNPLPQNLSVTAPVSVTFSAAAGVQSGGRAWLELSPAGIMATNQTLTVSVSLSGLAVGTYKGTISLVSIGRTISVPVTFNVSAPSGGVVSGNAGYKLIGWNDLGMHCFDGKDYSVFAVLPPYNTIHAHLLDSTGKLVTSGTGYAVTYEAVTHPLTNTINTTSIGKTNFWEFRLRGGLRIAAAGRGVERQRDARVGEPATRNDVKRRGQHVSGRRHSDHALCRQRGSELLSDG